MTLFSTPDQAIIFPLEHLPAKKTLHIFWSFCHLLFGQKTSTPCPSRRVKHSRITAYIFKYPLRQNLSAVLLSVSILLMVFLPTPMPAITARKATAVPKTHFLCCHWRWNHGQLKGTWQGDPAKWAQSDLPERSECSLICLVKCHC